MKPMFILVDDMSYKNTKYIWYVCGLRYYKKPTSSWVLSCTQSQKKGDAMEFCEEKAKLLAEILNNQEDEEGYSSNWLIEKV